MTLPSHPPDPTTPRDAIGDAVQRLTAARLGRAFMPLAALAAWGVVRIGTGAATGEAWILVLGSLATAAAMLAFGLRNSQLAYGRRPRAWMRGAMLGSVIPPVFTLYVVGWPGLRSVATGDGTLVRLAGLMVAGFGLWALRSWMRLTEVERLARAMTGTEPGVHEREDV